MFDIKNYILEDIRFQKYSSSRLIFYKKNKIQFYLKKSRTITGITEYNGKKNILVKIEDEYRDFIEIIEKKYIEEYNIDEKNFISLLKKNKNGTIIKLKINKKKNNSLINIYDEHNEEILEEDLEKNQNVDCLIEMDRFWNYNDKCGYIILVKKITKKYTKKKLN